MMHEEVKQQLDPEVVSVIEKMEQRVAGKQKVDIRGWWVVYRAGDETIVGIFPEESLAVTCHRDLVSHFPAVNLEIGRIASH